MRHIDVDYYGYRDEDDGVILEEEEKREKEGEFQLLFVSEEMNFGPEGLSFYEVVTSFCTYDSFEKSKRKLRPKPEWSVVHF